jgi:hypothetical protein
VIFQCFKCQTVFESAGLQVIVHDQVAGYVCPACIANAETIHVVLNCPSPGKPFSIAAVEVTKREEQPPKQGFTA